jgi:hypothetical protein
MPVFAALDQGDQLPPVRRNVILHGADLTEARTNAGEIAERDGLTFIHPFDNATSSRARERWARDPRADTRRRGDRRARGRRRPDRGHRHRGQAKRPDVKIIGVEPTERRVSPKRWRRTSRRS